MADRRVTFIIGANIKNFTKGLNKAQRTFKNFGRDMQRMGSTLTRSVTLPLVGAGAAAIKTAADYESLRQSMDILNGSAEEGARNFERLKRFSARTPFQLKDLAEAQNMLQGFGQSADEAFESMSMIGDIAAVASGDIKGIGIAFGQAAAEGRVMTRDIRQFINQGVPMIKMLSETMGVAQSEILDLASDGKISFDILQQAFREATSEGGMFADGMEKQSKTIAGLFSTLKDNVSIALGEIGDELVKTLNLKELMGDLIEQIQIAVQWFKNLSDEAKRMGVAIAGIAIVAGPTLFALGKMVTLLAAIMSPATIATAAIVGLFTGVVTTGQWFVDNWGKIAQGFENAMLTIEITASKMARGVINSFKGVINFLTMMTPPELLSGLFGIDLSEAAFDLIGVNKLLDDLENTINTKTIDLTEGIKKFNEQGWGSMSESAKNALELTKNTIINGLKGILNSSQIQDLLGQIESFFTPSGIGQGSRESPIGSAGIKRSPIRTFTKDLSDAKVAASEFGSITEAALQGVDRKLEGVSELGMIVGDSLGQAFSQAALHARNLGDAIKNIGKQLAGRAIGNFFSLLLGGGLGSVFSGGLFKGLGKLFGGVFHSGGVVPGPIGQERLILAQGGETVLTPRQMSAMGGGGNIKLSGEFRVKGTDLVMVLEQAKKTYR